MKINLTVKQKGSETVPLRDGCVSQQCEMGYFCNRLAPELTILHHVSSFESKPSNSY